MKKYENIYDQFIKYLKEEEKNLNKNDKNLEKHHILPLHDGGKKGGPKILCTSKNHTLAHYYRYLAFKQKGDYVAFTMRWNQTIGLKERCLLSIKKNKKLKNTFWNSEWQSIQGKKGGKIGGSKNTKKQYEARKAVGKKYGFGLNTDNQKKARQLGGLKNSNKQKIARSRVGISRQTPELKRFLSKQTIWHHQLNGEIHKIYVSPKKSIVEISNFLKTKIPNLKNLKNANIKIQNNIIGRTSKIFIQNSSNIRESLSLFFIFL